MLPELPLVHPPPEYRLPCSLPEAIEFPGMDVTLQQILALRTVCHVLLRTTQRGSRVAAFNVTECHRER